MKNNRMPIFMTRNILLLILFGLIGKLPASAQKVLQIERYGKAKTEKFYVGQELTFKLKGDEEWQSAYIEGLLVEENIVLLGPRYVRLDSISALRFTRNWTKAASLTLFWFGTGWSAFALIGTATDGDPETKYQASDAIVTGTSWFLAFIIPRLFKYKKIKFGEKKRLRMLDLSFKQGP